MNDDKEQKQRVVAICRNYIKQFVIPQNPTNYLKSRRDYVYAMREQGIKQGTIDYTWKQYFDKGGKLK